MMPPWPHPLGFSIAERCKGVTPCARLFANPLKIEDVLINFRLTPAGCRQHLRSHCGAAGGGEPASRRLAVTTPAPMPGSREAPTSDAIRRLFPSTHRMQLRHAACSVQSGELAAPNPLRIARERNSFIDPS